MRAGLFSISFKFSLVFTLLLSLSSCGSYRRQAITGQPITIDNAYADPSYDHSHIVNVLVLPIDNPLNNKEQVFHQKEILLSLMRGWGKFNYFNLQYDPSYPSGAGRLINLDTGFIDRVSLGEVGRSYGVQAVLKTAISDYRPYAPMRMKVKAWLVDCEHGTRVWAFDHVFDTDDSNVVNGLRVWWNQQMAGGDAQTRFAVSKLRPTIFSNFVFHTMAYSYERSRILNVEAVAQEACRQKVSLKEMEDIQWDAGCK